MGNFFLLLVCMKNGDFVEILIRQMATHFILIWQIFHVNITMPKKKFKIASSGEQIKSATSNGNITTEIKVDVRDFCFCS